MPDVLDSTGLTVKTLSEITLDLQGLFQSIYGADINLDQNSPDGQLIGIIAQYCADTRELSVQINNGFDPDQATGRVLDQRVVINNIARAGGTFTIVPIDVTVTQTVTLAGLDGAADDVNGTGFTIQDNAGNQFILIDSVTLTPGLTTVDFRARQIGLVEVTVNTIINFVTVIIGVTTVNNSVGALTIGQAEETDAQLRTRRQQSVALSSNGYLNGLLGTVLALDGVTDAKLYENVTDSTDGNGIPAHGIWLIVEGGANTDIGMAIYDKKSYGANMKGSVTDVITTPSGGIFTAKFDRPTASPLYIQFDLHATASGVSFNQAAIKQYIVDNTEYSIGQYAAVSEIIQTAMAAVNANGGNGEVSLLQISSDGSTWVSYLTVAALNDQWVLDVSRITITVI